MADIRAGNAFIEFSLRDSKLRKGLDNISKRLRSFGTILTGVGAGISGVAAAIGAPLLAASKQFQTIGDAAQKAAIRTGLTTREISELGFAAEQSGASMSGLVQAVFRMTRRIGNAATATGPAVRALEELGISAEKLSEQSTNDQFLTIVDSLGGVANEGRRAQLAFEIFGDNVRSLMPLLESGADGIQALRNEARELGRSVSQGDADAAAELGDAWNRFSSAISGVSFQIGAAIAQPLSRAITAVAQFVGGVSEWIGQNRALVVTIAKVALALGAVGAAVTAVGVAIVGAGAGVAAFSALLGGIGTVVAAVLSPMGLLTAGVVALGVAVVQYFGGASVVIDFLKNRFGGLVNAVKDAVGAMGQALARGDLKAAADVLWASLRVAWAQGVAYLNQQWADWKSYFQEVYTSAFFAFAETLTNIFAGFQVAWAQTVNFLGQEWANTLAGFRAGWAIAQNFIAKGILRLGGLLDESFDADGAIEQLNQSFRKQIDDIQKAQAATIGEREAARTADLQRVDAERRAALEALRQERARQLGDIGKEDAARVEQAQRELAQAQDAWTAAISNAGGPPDSAETADPNSLSTRLKALFDEISVPENTPGATAESQFGGQNAGLAFGQTQTMQKTLEKQLQAANDQIKETRKVSETIRSNALGFA